MFSKLTHSVRSRLQAFLQVPTEDEVNFAANSAAEAEIQRSINEGELCGDLYDRVEDIEYERENEPPFDAQAYTEQLAESLMDAGVINQDQAEKIIEFHSHL